MLGMSRERAAPVSFDSVRVNKWMEDMSYVRQSEWHDPPDFASSYHQASLLTIGSSKFAIIIKLRLS